jgi:hypothetical protein
MLTQERLKELLSYNPETGVFIRRINWGKTRKGDFAGTLRPDGYLQIAIDRRFYLTHRLVWFYVYGYWPNKQVDHVNRVKTDNRIENLRDATPSENQWNTGKQNNNTSGYTGAFWDKRRNKWRAKLSVSCRVIYCGQYDTPEEAHTAYLAAKEQQHRIGERDESRTD